MMNSNGSIEGASSVSGYQQKVTRALNKIQMMHSETASSAKDNLSIVQNRHKSSTVMDSAAVDSARKQARIAVNAVNGPSLNKAMMRKVSLTKRNNTSGNFHGEEPYHNITDLHP